MSRIGKAPSPVPSGVDVTVAGGRVTVKGPKGSLEREIPGVITIRQEGDELLKILALTVRGKARRPRDLAARYGGEEFVALLPNTPLEHAIDIAERIRQAVVGLHAQHEDNEGGIVTVSIGVATAVPRPGDEVAALVEAADAAVYRAKEAGRNRVVAAGP